MAEHPAVEPTAMPRQAWGDRSAQAGLSPDIGSDAGVLEPEMTTAARGRPSCCALDA